MRDEALLDEWRARFAEPTTGTGGGEVLLRLDDALPDDTLATAGWTPNLSVDRHEFYETRRYSGSSSRAGFS